MQEMFQLEVERTLKSKFEWKLETETQRKLETRKLEENWQSGIEANIKTEM